jgi:hypothetical protein
MHHTQEYSKDKNTWHKGNETRVGGNFRVSNTSNGYHGILKQYWEKHASGTSVLIISETNVVKSEFQKEYPGWDIKTLDLFQVGVDIVADICACPNPINEKFDIIINQATLEHVYNPFQAMRNFTDSLNTNGIIVTHTHPPGYRYHQFPRDYFRFMVDWWFDLPSYIKELELLELYMHENMHVFSCYKLKMEE